MFFACRNHVYTLTQEQASAYSVVALRKIDNVLCEDHFKFINDDIKYDASIAELCNGMIHIHFYEVNVDMTYTLNLMDVLANLNAFVQYIALPRETYDAYMSTVTLATPKQINWVVL